MYSMIVNSIFYQNPIILSILRSYRKALSTDLFHRFAVLLLRGCPRHPALRARARGYNACKDLLLGTVLPRPSKDLFHRFAVPLPRARGRLHSEM